MKKIRYFFRIIWNFLKKIIKFIMKIVKFIIYIVMVAILIFNVFNFVSRNLFKKEIPTIGGYGLLEVVSGSMEPTIRVGDLVVIDTANHDYKESQIITFKDVNGNFVTHRIKEIREFTVITQGDANNTDDGEINKEDIEGVYVLKIDQVGTLFKSLQNPLVMILIFAIGIVVCVIVSTDKDMKPIDVEEDSDYQEFLKQKELIEKVNVKSKKK